MKQLNYMVVVISLAVSIVFGAYAAHAASFRPSRETCGARISRRHAPEDVAGTLEEEMACLRAGYKDIIGTTWNQFLRIDPNFELQNDPDIGYTIWQQQENEATQIIKKYTRGALAGRGSMVIYRSPRYLCDAWLVHRASYEPVNHYLMGQLLGYDPDDIKYFYEQNVGNPPQQPIISMIETMGASQKDVNKLRDLLDPYAWVRETTEHDLKQAAINSAYENDQKSAATWLAHMRPLCPHTT